MTIEKKNCDECIFKRYTFDKDGKGTIPICHGKYRSRHEAIVAISEDTCDMYNRGHELYETRKVDGINVDDLPPSKEYLTDPMDFSKEPVAICDHIRIGIDPCWRGEGTYCYCRLDCTSKMSLNDPTKMEENSRKSFITATTSAGIDESKLDV